MKLILLLALVTVISFIGFLIVFIWGLVKKKPIVKRISVVLFFVFVLLFVITGYVFLNTTYRKVSKALKPRTGMEIYTALFPSAPPNACVEVINAHDQLIPKLDNAILLEVNICPLELKRLLTLESYDAQIKNVKSIEIKEPLDWFNVKDWGDSVRVYSFTSEDLRNSRIIYCKYDSTKVLIKDMLD